MFGLSKPKIKQKNIFLVISGFSLHFPIDALNSFVRSPSITHYKFVDRRSRDNKAKFVDFH